jgi:hypothetical protein
MVGLCLKEEVFNILFTKQQQTLVATYQVIAAINYNTKSDHYICFVCFGIRDVFNC